MITALSTGAVLLASQFHDVSNGETLGEIAARYDVSVKDLLVFNNLDNPDRLRIGQQLIIPPKKGISRTYEVKRGDVLSKIASTYGMSVRDLVVFNSLKNPNDLFIGQELLIPETSGLDTPPPSPLPASLRKELDQIKVIPGKWKYIVIHHSATDRGSAKGMDRYHREERHMENGLAYHFVIGNGHGAGDGEISVGSRWRRQIKGGHVATTSLNEKSIGICLVGNFEKAPPTRKQMESLRALNEYLRKRCGLNRSRVKPHRDINPRPTKCPGKHFPTHLM